MSGTGLATTKYPVPIHLKLVEVVTFFFCDWLTNLLDRNWATKCCVFSIDFCNKSDFNSMNFSRESRCYFPGIESREYWQFPGNSRPRNSREESLHWLAHSLFHSLTQTVYSQRWQKRSLNRMDEVISTVSTQQHHSNQQQTFPQQKQHIRHVQVSGYWGEFNISSFPIGAKSTMGAFYWRDDGVTYPIT